MSTQELEGALLNELRELLSAERQVAWALPRLAAVTRCDALREALAVCRWETEGHLDRLEQALAMLGRPPRAIHCCAVADLIEEGLEKAWHAATDVADAELIALAQKLEHYQIASYAAACAWAESLHCEEVAGVLRTTLDEERRMDGLLSQIAGKVMQEA